MIVFLGQLADNYHMLHREAFWSKTLEQVCKRNKPVNVAKISISKLMKKSGSIFFSFFSSWNFNKRNVYLGNLFLCKIQRFLVFSRVIKQSVNGQTIELYINVIDQAWGQSAEDGWILAKLFFCFCMDRDEDERIKPISIHLDRVQVKK